MRFLKEPNKSKNERKAELSGMHEKLYKTYIECGNIDSFRIIVFSPDTSTRFDTKNTGANLYSRTHIVFRRK